MRRVAHAEDLSALVPAILDAAGLSSPGAVVRQRTGIGNHVYRVAREFIVRIGSGSDAREFGKSAELLTVLAGRVRCPELLFADVGCREFDFPVMVCRYVPGHTLKSLWSGLTDSQQRTVIAEICEEVCAIHAYDWRKLGAFRGMAPWAEMRRTRMEQAIAAARADSELDRSLVDGFARFWHTNEHCLDRADPAVLIHDDVHVGNVIVDDGLHLAALLDFDDAEVSPPEIEFWNMTDELLGLDGGPDLATIKQMLAGVYRFDGDEARTRFLLNEAYWQMLLLTEGVSWRSPADCRASAARKWERAFLGGHYDGWFE